MAKFGENLIWAVYGEDPNCDFGGHHHEPLLGYFRGTYDDVLMYAETLPNWKIWGSGGRIEQIKVQDVNIAAQKQKELIDIDKQIADLKAKKKNC